MTRSPDAKWQDPSFAVKRLLRRPTVSVDDYAPVKMSEPDMKELRALALSARASHPHEICFVFGVMPRSGTNYLERLLEAHFDVATCPNNLRELPFLAAPDGFSAFQTDIARFYPPNADVFMQHEWLAYAMAGYVNSVRSKAAEDKTLTVIKDPHMRNISLFDTLMPTEKAVLVVRDGRYVVDSTIRTWPLKPLGRTFEDVCLEWKSATQAALSYANSAPVSQIKLMRYEDVVADTLNQMVELFNWLGLDPARADQAMLTDAPVLGSSTHSKNASGEVAWTPVKNADGFNPTARPLEWTDAQREIFIRVCGETQTEAGYDAHI